MAKPGQDHPNQGAATLFVYVADLELEVDRVRKYCQLLVQDVEGAVAEIRARCQQEDLPHGPGTLAGDIGNLADNLATRLQDWQDYGDHHPAHDQVAGISLRPLVEQVFAWQQRVHDTPFVALRLELQCEVIQWFPGRLRHILENLISNALKFRSIDRGEARVGVAVAAHGDAYELRISDNGLGMSSAQPVASSWKDTVSSPDRSAGLGVGLSVVKVLVDQSGGSLTTYSDGGQGTTHVVVLPRYDLADFLDSASDQRPTPPPR